LRETDLPSPNIGSRGYHLRRVMAQAISQLEIAAEHYPNGEHPSAQAFTDFLNAAKSKVDTLVAD